MYLIWILVSYTRQYVVTQLHSDDYVAIIMYYVTYIVYRNEIKI